MYFKIEIASQVNNAYQSEVLASTSSADNNPDAIASAWFEPGFKIFETHTIPNREKTSSIEKSSLYRPSLWPETDFKEIRQKEVQQLNSTNNAIGARSSCSLSPTNNAVLTDFSKSALVDISNFIVEDRHPLIVRDEKSSNDRPYATCRFMDYQYSLYFPHTAQQIFRCWSFWRAHSDKTPVLITTKDRHWKLTMEREFNRGLIDSLQSLGVEIKNSSHLSLPNANAKDAQSISVRTTGPILNQNGDHYQTASVTDTQALRKELMSSLGIELPQSYCENTSRFPRIAIINRRKSRKIRNTKQIIEELTRYLNVNYAIPVGYFENAPFRNQVGMMASIDILITPHGAQETGIAFMPKCGQVLEILPEEYYFPRFFGTLAASAGIGHSFIHLAQNTSDQIMDVTNLDIPFLCPSIDRIRDAVATLVEQWKRCCGMNTDKSI